jgi:hypothetical protein
MSLQRLLGGVAQGVSRRRFLAGAGAAGWCGACAVSTQRIGQQARSGGSSGGPDLPTDDGELNQVPEHLKCNAQTDSDIIWYPARSATLRVGYYLRPGKHTLPVALQCPPAGQTCGGNATPAHVEFIWRCARQAIDTLRSYEFCPPLPFDVVLWNLSDRGYRGGTHPLGREIIVDNALLGSDAYGTILHEVFHRVQYAYNPNGWRVWQPNYAALEKPPGTGARVPLNPRGSILESGARVVERALVESSDRYRLDADFWLTNPGIPLFDTTAVTPGQNPHNPYAPVLFWLYVAEQHGQLANGLDTQRVMLDSLRSTSLEYLDYQFDIKTVREARGRMAGEGHFDEFLYDNAAERTLVQSETTWGNFLVALAMLGSPERDSRFTIRAAQSWRGAPLNRLAIAAGHEFEIDRLPLSLGHDAGASGEPTGLRLRPDPRALAAERESIRRRFLDAREIPEPFVALYPYAMMPFRVVIPADEETRLLRVQARAVEGLHDGLVQLLSIGRDRRLRDLVRHDLEAEPLMDRTIGCAGLGEVLILVASRTHAGNFELTLSRVHDRALVFATSWNAQPGRFLTIDPAAVETRWRANGFHLPRGGQGGTGETLELRLENRGDREAGTVFVDLDFKPRDSLFEPTARWQRIVTGQTHVTAVEPGRPARLIRLEAPNECRRRFAYGFPVGVCSKAPFDEEVTVLLPWQPERLVWNGQTRDPGDVVLRATVRATHNAERPMQVLCSPFGNPPLHVPSGHRLHRAGSRPGEPICRTLARCI